MAKFCEYCGAPLQEGARFCTGCGHPVAVKSQPSQPSQQRQQPSQGQPSQSQSQPRQSYGSQQGSQMKFQPSAQAAKMKETVAKKKKGGCGKVLLVVVIIVAAIVGISKYSEDRELKKTREEITKNYPELQKELEKKKQNKSKNQEQSDNGLTDFASLKVLKTEDGSISESSPAVTLCGVTIDAFPEMLKDGAKPVTVSMLESSVSKEGVRSENYELSMGAHERFKIPVEVSFPCSVSSNTDPVVEHYNIEAGVWEPLISFMDRDGSSVSAYFSSFSPARVSYLPIGVNPKIYYVATPDEEEPFVKQIKVADNYWEILQRINPKVYSDEVIKYQDDPENYAIEMPQLDPDMDLNAAYQAYTDVNTIWTFCDPMINLGIEALPMSSQSRVVSFMIDNAESLGNAMNAIPFVMMSAQLAYDLHNLGKEDTEEAFNTVALNLYKNLIGSSGTIYSMTTGFSHIGFTFAFLGVALFGMELDYFIDAAKAEQAANVEAVFNAYYRDVQPFDALHWYNVFENAYWEHDGNADAAMRDIKDAVDAYCGKFWEEVYNQDNDDILFAATSAGYRKVFFNATNEQKQALTEQQKIKVWKLIETKSMKIIQRFLVERLREKTLEELTKVTEIYNKELVFDVRETVEGSATAEYLGSTICFGSNREPYPDWHTNIPDDSRFEKGWTFEFPCSVYGYMQMGMPNQLLIYDYEEDFLNGASPDKVISFDANMQGDCVTRIEIITDDGKQLKLSSDEFTGYIWKVRFLGGGVSSYGGTALNEKIEEAMKNAVRNTRIKLQENGDFSTTSTGSSSGTDDSEGTLYNYSITANMSLSGHIDRNYYSKDRGHFTMKTTIKYHHTAKDDYLGNDEASYTYTFDVTGKITSGIGVGSDGVMDPEFIGKGTLIRNGTFVHTKGKSYGDKDGSETYNTKANVSVEMDFTGNN